MIKKYEKPELLLLPLNYDLLTESGDNDAPFNDGSEPQDEGWGFYY